jgi:Ni,Fe-hydrogenase III small subunit
MLEFLRARLRQGFQTSAFPDTWPEFPERFRGRPALDAERCPEGCRECEASSPTAFIRLRGDGAPELDVGACLFSPEEGAVCPHGALWFTRDHQMASATRDGLVGTSGGVTLARALHERTRRLFGRSLRLRSVAAGSCNGCEAELVALGNVVFDMARFGIQFVASPRHADGLVITGAVNRNMRTALLKTYEAVPEPRLVIGSPEVENGVPGEIPVDLWVPGCPPHPLTVLDGLLRLLGRIEDGTPGRAVTVRTPRGGSA